MIKGDQQKTDGEKTRRIILPRRRERKSGKSLHPDSPGALLRVEAPFFCLLRGGDRLAFPQFLELGGVPSAEDDTAGPPPLPLSSLPRPEIDAVRRRQQRQGPHCPDHHIPWSSGGGCSSEAPGTGIHSHSRSLHKPHPRYADDRPPHRARATLNNNGTPEVERESFQPPLL